MSILIRTGFPSIAKVAKMYGISPERMKEIGDFVMSSPIRVKKAGAKKKAAKKVAAKRRAAAKKGRAKATR